MIDSISAVTADAKANMTTDQKGLTQNFDQFLSLLTTQLQNQDPLDPMDVGEFTNQLVSFSGVEQQIKTNENLKKLVGLTKASETTLGLSYIGLNIDLNGDKFEYPGGGTVNTAYTLPKDASITNVAIVDASGNTVYSEDGKLTMGKHKFAWDGFDSTGQQAPAGVYHLKVSALDSVQKNITAQTVVPGFVTGVLTNDDGSLDLIVGSLDTQKVPLADVTQASL